MDSLEVSFVMKKRGAFEVVIHNTYATKITNAERNDSLLDLDSL